MSIEKDGKIKELAAKRQEVSDKDTMSFQIKKNRKILRHHIQKKLDFIIIIILKAVDLRVISKISEIDEVLTTKVRSYSSCLPWSKRQTT